MDSLTMLMWVYRIAADLAGPLVVLGTTLKGRFGGRWQDRLGLVSAPAPRAGQTRLWFHGASVGEAKSAAAVIRALLAQADEKGLDVEVYFSVGTPAGLEAAENAFSEETRVTVFGAPLDFWGSPARALEALKPRALVILETELWPNLIEGTHKSGAKLVLAAARLTSRSFRRYKIVGKFMAGLLGRFDLIAAMGETERDLYAALGAPPDRLTISGNPKFDRLLADAAAPAFQEKTRQWTRKIWGDEPRGPLIVAGSTHPGEEELIVRAFEAIISQYPAATLLLAPRHLGRISELMSFLNNRNLPVSLTSGSAPLIRSGGGPRVLLADQMGQLSSFYSLANVSIVGGSLIEGLMGHNPLEPAATSTPMLFGPHMASFALEARGLLAAGGAVETSAERLASDIEVWLKNPAEATRSARAGHDYLAGRPPAAPALASAILNLITA
ncbi:hypothetical protein C4J81_18250 [Deltaproteobacteria bacterium Smac51]|nr:hypothetical protein C4J81_18250 [Deltaproteobacteria bacterium Smac51]